MTAVRRAADLLRGLRRPYAMLYPFLARRRKAYAGLLLLMLLDVGLTLGGAWFLGAIADAALAGRFDRLRWLVPAGAALTGLGIAAGCWSNALTFAAVAGVKKDLRAHLLDRVLRLPAKEANRLQAGAVMTHFTDDVHGIDGMIGGSLIQLVRLPLVFAAVLVYMAGIHWTMTLLSLLVVPAALGSAALFGALLRRNGRRVQEAGERANVMLSETLYGLPVIRAFAMERPMYRKYADMNDALYRLERKDNRLRGRFYAGGEAAASAAYLIGICLGAFFVSAGVLSVGSLLAFVNLTGHLVYPLTGIAGIWAGMQYAVTSAERLARILDLPAEKDDGGAARAAAADPARPGAHGPAAAGGAPQAEARSAPRAGGAAPGHADPARAGRPPSVSFRSVTFAYDGERPLFDRLSLDIPAGRTTAIVGASGAGKTTLFQLLMRFYEPAAGSILIGGMPADRLPLQSLRGMTAFVPQETFLFSGTIRDNILFGRPDADERALRRAAADAGIDGYIESLPDGYDTAVGERGFRLSGGQKQRLAIARAFLKDAPLLLLDEPTSALDGDAEQAVKEALQRLAPGRTTIVAAHRMSTVRHADLIVVLENGAIVQAGRHEELMKAGGAYRRLHRLSS